MCCQHTGAPGNPLTGLPLSCWHIVTTAGFHGFSPLLWAAVIQKAHIPLHCHSPQLSTIHSLSHCLLHANCLPYSSCLAHKTVLCNAVYVCLSELNSAGYCTMLGVWVHDSVLDGKDCCSHEASYLLNTGATNKTVPCIFRDAWHCLYVGLLFHGSCVQHHLRHWLCDDFKELSVLQVVASGCSC